MTSKSGKIASVLIALLLCGGIAQWYYFYPLLPESVADHFNINGMPDSWIEKDFFLWLDNILTLFVSLFFLIGSRLTFKLPKILFNIPNPEYWLKDEQQRNTVIKLSTYVLWMGVLSLTFVRTRFQHIYHINAKGISVTSNFFWIWFFVYVAAVIAFTWHFASSFELSAEKSLSKQNV